MLAHRWFGFDGLFEALRVEIQDGLSKSKMVYLVQMV